jgi:hypothetical protein
MNYETKESLKSLFIKLAHQIIGLYSDELKVYIYHDELTEDIFYEYEKIKEDIKNNIIDAEFLADRHKIAAFFISSIMKKEPIKIKVNKTDISDNELSMLVNFNLSIVFANYVIKVFYKKRYNKELKIISPKSYDDKSKKTYNDQLFTLVRDIINMEEKVLLLTLSHILFLIEKYSECMQNK